MWSKYWIINYWLLTTDYQLPSSMYWVSGQIYENVHMIFFGTKRPKKKLKNEIQVCNHQPPSAETWNSVLSVSSRWFMIKHIYENVHRKFSWHSKTQKKWQMWFQTWISFFNFSFGSVGAKNISCAHFHRSVWSWITDYWPLSAGFRVSALGSFDNFVCELLSPTFQHETCVYCIGITKCWVLGAKSRILKLSV